jgi:hypothetical protein
MLVVMLGGMPLTAVLLTIVFLASDATDLISVVIVAVVVAYVASAHLSRWLPLPSPGPAAPAADAAVPAPRAGAADRADPAAPRDQSARAAKETGPGQ